MVEYKVELKRSVERDLRGIPAKDLRRILESIRGLMRDPRPAGCSKMTGEELYRIRIGKYRVVYEIHDDRVLVIVVKVGHRREVYR